MKTGTGARSWRYSEAHYLGNPGYYQTFVFTASSATPTGRFSNPDLQRMQEALAKARGWEAYPDAWAPDSEGPSDSPMRPAVDALRRLRRNSVITTITVIGGKAGHDDAWMPTDFVPLEDHLRTIP